MITIGDKSFKSNIPLESILAVKTKVDMLKIIQKLDLYVSPNLNSWTNSSKPEPMPTLYARPERQSTNFRSTVWFLPTKTRRRTNGTC